VAILRKLQEVVQQLARSVVKAGDMPEPVELAAQDELGRDAQKTVVLDQQSVGRLSRMDALQQQAMAKAQQNRRGASELRIRAALARIADDEFGYCSDCGEPIEKKRLEATTAPGSRYDATTILSVSIFIETRKSIRRLLYEQI